MALEKLAHVGNMMHFYDFRVKPGTGAAFIKAFDEYDVSAANPMHRSAAQVKDGVLCRDYSDPDHFFLIGEWSSVEEHRAILQEMRKEKTRDLSPKVSWDGSRMKTSPTGIAVPEKSWGGGSMVALIAEMRCGLSLAPPEDIWVQDPLPEESCGGGSMMELPASISVPKVSQDFPPKKPWAGLRLVKLRETLDTYKTVIAHFNEL